MNSVCGLGHKFFLFSLCLPSRVFFLQFFYKHFFESVASTKVNPENWSCQVQIWSFCIDRWSSTSSSSSSSTLSKTWRRNSATTNSQATKHHKVDESVALSLARKLQPRWFSLTLGKKDSLSSRVKTKKNQLYEKIISEETFRSQTENFSSKILIAKKINRVVRWKRNERWNEEAD